MEALEISEKRVRAGSVPVLVMTLAALAAKAHQHMIGPHFDGRPAAGAAVELLGNAHRQHDFQPVDISSSNARAARG